jgi:hypothetical protein
MTREQLNCGNRPRNWDSVRLIIVGEMYRLEGVDLKKAKFHYKAAAMAGH